MKKKKKKKKSKREIKKRQKENKDRWIAAHPASYIYMNVRNRARQRGRPFSMSLEWFTTWCFESGYLDVRGKKSSSGSIDCKVEELGYAEGNLQVLTLGENALKQRMKEKGITYYRGMNDQPYTPEEIAEAWVVPDIDVEF